MKDALDKHMAGVPYRIVGASAIEPFDDTSWSQWVYLQIGKGRDARPVAEWFLIQGGQATYGPDVPE